MQAHKYILLCCLPLMSHYSMIPDRPADGSVNDGLPPQCPSIHSVKLLPQFATLWFVGFFKRFLLLFFPSVLSRLRIIFSVKL